MAPPLPPDEQIDAALITPTCTHFTAANGLMYATPRVYKLMVEQAAANHQEISVMEVAAIYDLNDGVYIQFDKASEDEKNRTPVRLIRIGVNGETLSMTLDHQIKAACASLSRLHFKAWEEKWRTLLEVDEEEEFEISEEDLDAVPLEELHAAIMRRKR